MDSRRRFHGSTRIRYYTSPATAEFVEPRNRADSRTLCHPMICNSQSGPDGCLLEHPHGCRLDTFRRGSVLQTRARRCPLGGANRINPTGIASPLYVTVPVTTTRSKSPPEQPPNRTKMERVNSDRREMTAANIGQLRGIPRMSQTSNVFFVSHFRNRGGGGRIGYHR